MAVESYGFAAYRDLLGGAGLRIPRVDVDELGARTEDLAHLRDVGAVLMTPAHQYPTGVALHPDRRAAAVDWARATGALILEDDYDGEFRYDRDPVGALQGLDPERVVYFGSASKSLAPGLRLAWMVLPDELVAGDRGGQGARRLVERVGTTDPRRVHRVGRLRPPRAIDAAALPTPP